MNQREKLIEHLEDALFAVIMNDYMEVEGAKLIELNERLKRDPEARVPEEADEKCRRLIRREYRKSRRKARGRSAYRVVSKAALVACCMILLFTTAFAASPALREKTLSLIIQAYDVSTEFEFHDAGRLAEDGQPAAEAGGRQLGNYCFSHIPEEFSFVEDYSDDVHEWMCYANDDGAMLYIEVLHTKGQFSADTEGAQYTEPVLINDFEGIYVEKDGVATYYLGDALHIGYIMVKGTGVDREVLDGVVDGIFYQE